MGVPRCNKGGSCHPAANCQKGSREKNTNVSKPDRPHEHSAQFQYFESERENTKHPVITFGDGGDFNELAKQADNPATGVKLSGEGEFGTKQSGLFGGEPSSNSGGGKDSKYQRHQNEPRYVPPEDIKGVKDTFIDKTRDFKDTIKTRASDIKEDLHGRQHTSDSASDSGKQMLSHTKEAAKEKTATFGKDTDQPLDSKQFHQERYEEHKEEAKEHGESFLQSAVDVAAGAAQSVKETTFNIFQKAGDALGFSSNASDSNPSDESNLRGSGWTSGPEGTTLGDPSAQSGTSDNQ